MVKLEEWLPENNDTSLQELNYFNKYHVDEISKSNYQSSSNSDTDNMSLLPDPLAKADSLLQNPSNSPGNNLKNPNPNLKQIRNNSILSPQSPGFKKGISLNIEGKFCKSAKVIKL